MLVATLAVAFLLLVAAQVDYSHVYPDAGRGPSRVLDTVADRLEGGFRRAGRLCARHLNVFTWLRTSVVVEVLAVEVPVATYEVARRVWRIAFSWVHAARELAHSYFWVSTALLADLFVWCRRPELGPHAAYFTVVMFLVTFFTRELFDNGPLARTVSGIMLFLIAAALAAWTLAAPPA